MSQVTYDGPEIFVPDHLSFCLCRWALCVRYWSGGTLWWGQKRNNSSAFNQTDGSQRASQGPSRECKTPVCLSFSSPVWLIAALNWSIYLLVQGNKETGLEKVIDTVALFKLVWHADNCQSTLNTVNSDVIQQAWLATVSTQCSRVCIYLYCFQETRCDGSRPVWTTTWVKQKL